MSEFEHRSKSSAYPSSHGNSVATPGKQTLTGGALPKTTHDLEGHNKQHTLSPELFVATERVWIALQALFNNRVFGVEAARADAEKYKQVRTPHNDSLLGSLALAGLDIATAGIAGALARRLEGPLKNILSHSQWHAGTAMRYAGYDVHVPSEVLINGITDSIKETVKSTEAVLQKPPTAESASKDSVQTRPISQDPMTNFFTLEKIALSAAHASEASKVPLMANFTPLYDAPVDVAVNAMNRIVTEIIAIQQDAAFLQSQASAFHWMRYLAQVSMGSIVQGAGTVTDISNVNLRPTSGLVEVFFLASAAHPEQPVKVTTVFVQGVSNLIARRLSEQPLIQAGLPVRARGLPSDGDFNMPVTVTSDESGNIFYSDQTGAPGAPGASWLARKGGGRGQELLGARALMSELTGQRISPELIVTDSVDHS